MFLLYRECRISGRDDNSPVQRRLVATFHTEAEASLVGNKMRTRDGGYHTVWYCVEPLHPLAR